MAITPITRKENFLARAAGENGLELEPVTREEYYLNKIAEGGGGGGGGGDYEPKTNKVTVSDTDASIAPTDHTIYNCGTLTSLTVTNPPSTGAYSIVFTSGSTATSTTFPATILGLESFAAEANTLYEINVLDNRAVVGSWAVSSGE